MRYYFKRYSNDSSIYTSFEGSSLIQNFEGFESLGDLNNDGILDSVFVLPQLNYSLFDGEKSCDGDAYYFTDSLFPRLQTNSVCCHPNSIFSVGDIDEDGIDEIGQYYSSCVSRFKSLYVYTLKGRRWKEIGHCVYDLFYAPEHKPFSYFVKKTAKNKFKMLEITDLTEQKNIGKRNWKVFSM